MKVLQTQRLTLRPLNIKDINDVFSIMSDPQTAWWADLLPMTDELEAFDLINWGNRGQDLGQWGICEKGSRTVIGLLQVMNPLYTGEDGRFDLGYMLDPAYRRLGYMSEAVDAACRYLFGEPSVETIALEILPGNEASRGVARKAGFALKDEEAPLRPRRRLDGEPLDTFILKRDSVPASTAA